MFGLGMMEILMILAIALIVVGPKKLPELAKTLGRAMGDFKRSAQDLKRSMDVESTVKDIVDLPKTNLKEILSDSSKDDQNDIKDEVTEDNSDQDPDSFERQDSSDSSTALDDINSDDTDIDDTLSHTADSDKEEPEPDNQEANDADAVEPDDKSNNSGSDITKPTQ